MTNNEEEARTKIKLGWYLWSLATVLFGIGFGMLHIIAGICVSALFLIIAALINLSQGYKWVQ